MKAETVRQTKQIILNFIVEQGLGVGNTLPSIRKLQTALFISKNAALEAIHVLCDEGILEKGTGTRNGFSIRSIPEEVACPVKEKKLVARLMVPFNPWNYVGNQFLIHVEKEFSLRGGSVLLNNTENSPAIERQLLQSLLVSGAHKPDVLLLMPSSSGSENVDLLRRIQQEIPVLLIDRKIYGFDCHLLSLDHHCVGYDAVNRLWSKGHRTFAFVSGFARISAIQERLSGYRDALRVHDCPPDNQYVFLEDQLDTGSYHKIRGQIDQLAEQLLALSPRPTGIVCGSDRIATCLINYFISRNVSVPEEIAVTGCDGDTEFSDFCEVQLSSYRQPFGTMAQLIYQTAADIHDNPKLSYYKIEFQPEYLPGNTI